MAIKMFLYMLVYFVIWSLFAYLYRRRILSFRWFGAFLVALGIAGVYAFLVLMGLDLRGSNWLFLSVFALAGGALGYQSARVVRQIGELEQRRTSEEAHNRKP